jgi:maltooligosyltrehalose trehalohydrolase
MRRGDLLVVVNAGDTAATTEVGPREVLFETPTGVALEGTTLSLPPHTGAMLR